MSTFSDPVDVPRHAAQRHSLPCRRLGVPRVRFVLGEFLFSWDPRTRVKNVRDKKKKNDGASRILLGGRGADGRGADRREHGPPRRMLCASASHRRKALCVRFVCQQVWSCRPSRAVCACGWLSAQSFCGSAFWGTSGRPCICTVRAYSCHF